jgi:hypothetical protein
VLIRSVLGVGGVAWELVVLRAPSCDQLWSVCAVVVTNGDDVSSLGSRFLTSTMSEQVFLSLHQAWWFARCACGSQMRGVHDPRVQSDGRFHRGSVNIGAAAAAASVLTLVCVAGEGTAAGRPAGPVLGQIGTHA